MCHSRLLAVASLLHSLLDVVALEQHARLPKSHPTPPWRCNHLACHIHASPWVLCWCLQGYAGLTVVGDRDHILLLLTNVSLPVLAAGSNGSSTVQAVEVMSPMSWVGYNPGSRREVVASAAGEPQLGDARGKDGTVFLDCVYQQGAVVIPANLGKDALQLQQLVLSHLPQGRGAAVPGQFKALPSTLFTVNLWSFDR